MATVASKDGTPIAYSRVGSGPALVIVDGALCYRAFGPSQPLAKELAPQFSVFTYDRRGRGESGDATDYAPAREVDDLSAVIEAAGGSVILVGVSSGAALSLEAADALGPKKVVCAVLYEAPFFTDDGHTPLPDDFVPKMKQHLADGHPGRAVKMFMRLVGTPAPAVVMMSLMPMWKRLCNTAATLPYDFAFMAKYQQGTPLPVGNWARATMPILVGEGGKSPEWMRHSQRQLAEVLPQATIKTFEGQTHMIAAPVLAEAVRAFGEGVAV